MAQTWLGWSIVIPRSRYGCDADRQPTPRHALRPGWCRRATVPPGTPRIGGRGRGGPNRGGCERGGDHRGDPGAEATSIACGLTWLIRAGSLAQRSGLTSRAQASQRPARSVRHPGAPAHVRSQGSRSTRPSARAARPNFTTQRRARLIGEVQAPLGQKLFHIAVAQGEARIRPRRVPDDFGRELVASVGEGLHGAARPCIVAGRPPSRDNAPGLRGGAAIRNHNLCAPMLPDKLEQRAGI